MEKRMYKVLVADDEYWTREKIRRMIPWESYSLEFLEPAADGEEVLRRMEEECPDILITDINMPFLNGVDLLSRMHEQYPDVVTFVISGYDDFEYVKGTFMSGSINYLIKPITRIDLVNALTRALELISERAHEKEELLKAGSALQDREFSHLIEHKDTSFVPSVTLNSGMDLAGMSLMLIKIHNLKELARQNGHDMNRLSYNLKKQIRDQLGYEKAIIFNHVYRSNEFIVVSEQVERELEKGAKKLLQYFSSCVQSPVTVCISGHSYSMESIHMAYVEAVGLLMTRRYCAEHEILIPGKMKTGDGKMNQYVQGVYEKQIRNCLMTGNKEELSEIIFERIGLGHCVEKSWSYLEVRQTVRQILNLLTECAYQETSGMTPGEMESMIESADKTVEAMDQPALCEMLQEIILLLLPEQKETATDSMKDIARRAADWLEEHYAEELTLSSLAERYHVESSYFSRIFRQETGQNLILYITNRRIEKAKEYMRESRTNLAEIAFLVGYDDYTYFSRVFRKHTGMSPREYRSSCGEGRA